MRRAPALGLATALLLGTLVTGCTSSTKEEPMPTEIPSKPAAGADLACGMDRVDVEAAMGLEIGRVEGDLETADADGKRECDIWPTDTSLVDGAMVFVSVLPASSTEGQKLRAEVDGTATGVTEPSVRYTDLDGAAWSGSVGASSVVFVGDQVVALTSTWKGDGRDPLKDLPALSSQVAASTGLAGS
ncbi:hypothetical protein [Cellulomonas rhizosphaerae]|uniref:DUF3558 domain-containing protein n=1 Tax=Cellulomonas rhizosphaerae TaxID=2293719 RepID=A0A413RPH9_9CELL|nr:hypothetical protein [Cellulomonas rhizosphaerae]RHA43820.1 hypothetical protein D1825_04375 [Cellulomonas rhizosphaerae]